jgi:hypothetical protein
MGRDISVGSTENVYLTGVTDSTDFPVENAVQPSRAGILDDAFIVQLNSAGNGLLYSTYLGGTHNDEGRGIAVDEFGNAYVTGTTSSTNFPVLNPIQTGSGAFLAKIDTVGALVYSTCMIGAQGFAVAVDSVGNAYVTGQAGYSFTTVRGYQPPPDITNTDSFVTEVNASGSEYVFSTCIGGSGHDTGTDIDIDADGYVYVGGVSQSDDFPLVNPFQVSFSGVTDAIVFKLNPFTANVSLEYSTYLGGNGMYDYIYAIAVEDSAHDSKSA